jgi:hypothetical protein
MKPFFPKTSGIFATEIFRSLLDHKSEVSLFVCSNLNSKLYTANRAISNCKNLKGIDVETHAILVFD